MFKSIKTKTVLALATAGLAVTAAGAQGIGQWYGTFQYEHEIGPTGANGDGPVAFRTYTLRLAPPTRGTGCTVTVTGYQIDQQLQCTATPQMGSLIVKYFNLRPRAPYYNGQPLLTLTRSENGIVTHWQAIGVPEGAPSRGMAMRRIR